MTTIGTDAATTTLRVSDLGLIAFLEFRGHCLLGLEGRPGKRLFVFPAATQADAQIFVTDPPVGAASYAEALRRAKAIIATANLTA